MKIPVPEQVFQYGIGISGQRKNAMIWVWSENDSKTLQAYIIPQIVDNITRSIHLSTGMFKVDNWQASTFIINGNEVLGYDFIQPTQFQITYPYKPDSVSIISGTGNYIVPVITVSPTQQENEMTENEVRNIINQEINSFVNNSFENVMWSKIRPFLKPINRFVEMFKNVHLFTEDRREAARIKFGIAKTNTGTPLNEFWKHEGTRYAVLDLSVLPPGDPSLTLTIKDAE